MQAEFFLEQANKELNKNIPVLKKKHIVSIPIHGR
jgi:hypothetical protein